MANDALGLAKLAKNDEFYTQFDDIEQEVNAYLDYDANVFRGKSVLLPCDDPEWSNFTKFFAENFTRLGLAKLVSTSFAPEAKRQKYGLALPKQAELFERESLLYDEKKTNTKGKIFVLDATNAGGVSDWDSMRHAWRYLGGTGDFASDEVCALRDEADFVITNPPFSLFREFVSWIRAAPTHKRFLIIGNMNAITYKEIFPLIKENQLWLGATGFVTDMVFGVPEGAVVKEADRAKAAKLGYVGNYTRLGNSCWFTNMEHGRRHEVMQLDTMQANIRHNKKIHGAYPHYDNYDAIEVASTDAIPRDYDGVMGVPISFLDRYCPEQFEIVGCTANGLVDEAQKLPWHKPHNNPFINGEAKYQRILIRHRKGSGAGEGGGDK